MKIAVVASTESDLPLSWDAVMAGQRAGQDPTAGWRARLAAGTTGTSGAPVPPVMPAAFVLQWLLEVAAEAGVEVSLHHRAVVDPGVAGLTFALDPVQLYPVAAQVRVVTATVKAVDARLRAAQRAYLVAGSQLAESYDPGVNLGSHQRLAMVDDVWAMTVARSRGQQPPPRRSCCFIYVLPHAHECVGCPRWGRPPGPASADR